ncbi:spinster family MFS transporter [Streptomyces sp. NBC_01264]|uniref:spinster family MFS transporter n=1 Tax=Streptomyces sp. NBC_01264 TaxID=2903804 RepID=UPI00225372AD|nr:MFS transporter [Streptomyces sp. NBC_01264]MCX4781975.1 MFS transporter [Streptomyces sp. NBC_01264]
MARSLTKPEPSDRPPAPRSPAGYVLGLLFLGNLLNFYDRALPSVVLEPIKDEFGLDDTQVGILASAFVLVAALAGIPLGRLADRVPRAAVAGWGLFAWSAFTAAGGVLTSLWGFFASRIGVGVGEASYAPATGSLLSDLYPSERRSRAHSLFMLGFPLGTLLAFLTAGGLAVAFDSWRAPFLIAAVPGFVVALLVLRIREPERGAADPVEAAPPGPRGRRGAPLRSLLKVHSMYGMLLAFAGYNFAAYAIGTFLTPVLQRYHGLSLVGAGAVGGIVVGVTGFVGLFAGGRILDRAARTSPEARVRVAAYSLFGAAALSLAGLAAGRGALWQFVVFLSLGYLLGIVYLAAAVPVVSDIIRPEQRSGALGLLFAVGYLLGGAGGPVLVGVLSDALAAGAQSTTGASAHGLRTALVITVPLAFAVAASGMLLASRFVRGDREAMLSPVTTP